jgi:hypothetical protein
MLPTRSNLLLTKRGRDDLLERTIERNVAWAEVELLSPRNGPEKHGEAIPGWCVRAWESVPSSRTGEPMEWMLFSTVSVQSVDDALERLTWYSLRWRVEEYHKALKRGCAMEERQLGTADGFERLLGFLTVVAVRFLQIRCLSRSNPETLAEQVIDPVALEVLAARLGWEISSLTLREFWHGVARLGGLLGLNSDEELG